MIRGSAFALGFLSLAVFAAWPASAATGDWTQYGFTAQGRRENTQETVLTTKSVAHLTQKWSANITVVFSSAAVANGIVYVGAADGNLYAFDARSGAPVWKAATGGPIYSSPAVADGLVYVGSNDGRVYAFDAETGAVRWATLTGYGAVQSPVTVVHGLVYAGTITGSMFAIHAKTGIVKWTAAEIAFGPISAPAVARGVAYFAGGELDAFDARTGAPLWQNKGWGDPFYAPAVDRGAVFVRSNPTLAAFDATTGALRWSTFSGTTQWGSIAIGGGHIHAGSIDHLLWDFDTATGVLRHGTDVGLLVDNTPALANGVLYIGADKTISAFDARSSKLLWQAPTPDWVFAAPTVSNGMLYVGSGNQFSAYGLP
jgi:outer membrane protein assembly factor BamB